MKFNIKVFSSLAIILSFLTLQVQAQTPGQSYTIQANDWLSKVSNTAYQNPHLYHRIIDGTNEKALLDPSFRKITQANDLRIGQKVWIPNFDTNSTSTTTTTTSTSEAEESQLVELPKTNCEIRIWYNYQVVAISKLNEKWIDDGIDLATRAKKAYDLRHHARVNARFMMANPVEVKGLQARDMAKYGNPDGPTFDYLIQKIKKKEQASDEQAYQSIIESSSRTSPVFNSECQ